MIDFRSMSVLGCALALGACTQVSKNPTNVTVDSTDSPYQTPRDRAQGQAGELPAMLEFEGAKRVDHLIEPQEHRFAELYQLTFGGENAEAYWSFAGDRLILQRRNPDEGADCDRIYIFDELGLHQISNGQGVTTCSYFLPGDERALYASTFADMADCPPPPDMSQGYVWRLHPEYEIYSQELKSGRAVVLAPAPGYDAEATVSPSGDRIVFTSTRSGDPELWTCTLDGKDLRQVTDSPGYDGGAFFSHDGKRLIWRATAFTPDKEAEEIAEFARLLGGWMVRPSSMELVTGLRDGSSRTTLTKLGGANWAPFFTPDDSQVLFASNHHVGPRSRNFDLFLVPSTGGPHGPQAAERVTTFEGFDSFPMFRPGGGWLAFSSNRGGATEGETNLFVARWR